VCTAVILATFLRAGLIIVYPFFVLMFCYTLNFRLSVGLTILTLSSLILLPLSFIVNDQPFLFNTILSIYIIYPVLFLYLSHHSRMHKRIEIHSLDRRFIKYLTIIMFFNNLIGFVQYLILRHDDAFTGLFSSHGIGAHGMGIINGILFIHYFILFKSHPRWGLLFLMLFFLFSFVMSFFGLALVLLLASLVVYYLIFQLSLGNAFKFAALAIVALGVLFITSSKTFTYNYNILDNTTEMLNERDFSTSSEMPRKITVFYNYKEVFGDDIKLLLFGTGPGTFNSRSSFLLNGDYSDNFLVKTLGANEPAYAVENAYSLWNQHILSIQFNDGTRNQPFSSVLAFLAEYGLVFSIILFILIFRKLTLVANRMKRAAQDCEDTIEKNRFMLNHEFILVVGIFIMLLLISNNLMEHTEILIFVIIIKLMEMTIPHQEVVSPPTSIYVKK